MEDRRHYRRDLGKRGEDIACEFLHSIGHTILERNWRNGHLEIDIISLDAAGIHFVEVKTRRLSVQAQPQENVNHTKQARIAKAALGFLNTKTGLPYGSYECIFDIVAVTFDGDRARTEWFPQAYIPIYL